MAEKKIGADTYRCDKLDAEGAMRLLLRTTRMFGPASGVMSALTEPDKAKQEAGAIAAIAEFAAKLDEDEAIAYVKDLVGLCRCNGDPAIFGVTPSDLGDIFTLCFWVLEVQFRDFLGGGAGKALVRKALVRA